MFSAFIFFAHLGDETEPELVAPPPASSHLLQEDGTSKIILEDGSGDLLLET